MSSREVELPDQSAIHYELSGRNCQDLKIAPTEAERIVQGYTAGKSTKQLARESGRSRSSISAVLKRSGIEMRTFREASEADIRMMVYLYESGLSLRRVAERVGFSERTVLNRLREAGIQTRNSQGIYEKPENREVALLHTSLPSHQCQHCL